MVAREAYNLPVIVPILAALALGMERTTEEGMVWEVAPGLHVIQRVLGFYASNPPPCVLHD